MNSTLLQIVFLFGGLSLMAFGGGDSIIPDMQRASVNVHNWVTDREFIDLFAISRATPGPGILVVVLIGQRAAGMAGAIAAALGMLLPSSSLMYGVTRLWQNKETAPWRRILERTLAPVAIGAILAGGVVLIQSTQHSYVAFAITGISAAVLAFSRLSPLYTLAAAGAIGLVTNI